MLVLCLRHKKLQQFSHTSKFIVLLALQIVYFTTFDILTYPNLIQVNIWVKVHLAIFNIYYTCYHLLKGYMVLLSVLFLVYFKTVVHGKSGCKTSK